MYFQKRILTWEARDRALTFSSVFSCFKKCIYNTKRVFVNIYLRKICSADFMLFFRLFILSCLWTFACLVSKICCGKRTNRKMNKNMTWQTMLLMWIWLFCQDIKMAFLNHFNGLENFLSWRRNNIPWLGWASNKTKHKL